MLLVLMFGLTHIPLIRRVLDRPAKGWNGVLLAILFGLIGIAGTYAGVVVGKDAVTASFLAVPLGPSEMMAHSALVGVVLGGLLGGALIGAGAGAITGIHAAYMGGVASDSLGFSMPLLGLLAGLIARFFHEERIIAPPKSLFIGVFAPILQTGLVLVFTTSSPLSIVLVNEVGLPMVLTSSVGICLFVALVRAAFREEERAGALQMQRAFTIAEMVLPHLKEGMSEQAARATAAVLMRELEADAVGVTDRERLLAYRGPGYPDPAGFMAEPFAREALRTNRIQTLARKGQEPRLFNDLGAAVFVPLGGSGQPAGVLALYFRSAKQIRKIELEFASGFSRLIASQLTIMQAEQLEKMGRDAELRAMQAQIHPHFLFNTLNSIVTLIRIDPENARQLTVQLAQFMRSSLTMTQSSLIPLYREIEYLNAYLTIIRARFDDRLVVECVVEQGLEHVMLPPSTLQPLVENSVQHGLRSKSSGGWIRVELKREGDRVCAAVEDNGIGIPPDLRHALGEMPISGSGSTGLGIHNVNQRLKALLGADAALRFENLAGGGTRVSFTLLDDKGGHLADETDHSHRGRRTAG
ncbi:LytS/YhcK type 5TM receptor domain-containing protein [Paenibacillus aurantiacus]|uniref:LytS/YhcK type 5TM receptor domain-containing protein n=1 Tax=Paenibacillus aurantiacus TaxID=1936118 RepID=A0ABV5KIP6_9BACL